MMGNCMIAPRQDSRNVRTQNQRHPVRPMHCDIREYEDRYEIGLELPGFRKEDIKISLKDGYMSVHAEHPATENTPGRLLRSERYNGPYGRTFYVGDDIDENAGNATYENGILTISLHKVQEVPETDKYIEIK